MGVLVFCAVIFIWCGARQGRAFYGIIKREGTFVMDKTPFKYGRRKVGNRNNWEDLEQSYQLKSKPTIFIFGGNLTTTTREANGYAKLIGNSFKQFTASTADIISVSYEGEIAEKQGNDIVLSERAIINASDFVEKTIYPALKDAQTEQELQNILKKLIFVGHSAGANIISVITSKVENYLLYKLDNNKEKVDSLMESIQCFCYAPGTVIKQNITAFNVVPFYDTESKWKDLLFFTKGDIKAQYPGNFMENFDPLKPKIYTTKVLKEHMFVAVRKGPSLILITDKLTDKNDHSIACLKNTNTPYSAYVSELSESVLNRFLINALYNANYTFHDDFQMLRNFAVHATKESDKTEE